MSPSPPQLSMPWRLAAAPVAVLFVFLVQVGLLPRPAIAPFVFFFFGVALVSWLGGRASGLIAVVLSAALANYAFIDHPWAWATSNPAVRATVLYVVASSLVAFLCASFRDAVFRVQRAAAALRQQGQMLELSHDAILVWRPEGGIETWNRGAEELYGFSAQEARGRTTRELLKTTFARPWTEIEAELRQQRRWEGELAHTAKDGRRLAVSAKLQLIQIDDVDRVLEINRDITDRQRAEEALNQSEARFRHLADALPQMVFEVDAEGRAGYFNENWTRFTGCPAGEIESRVALVHPDDRARLAARWSQAVSTGSLYECEYRFRRHDGEYRWLLARAVPLRDAGGRLAHWFGTATDVHDLREAQELLRESEARQAFLLGLSDRLRALSDVGGIVTVASEMLGRQLGLSSVTYYEVEGDGTTAVARGGYGHRGMPDVVALHPPQPNESAFARVLRAGEEFFYRGDRTDPRSTPEEIAVSEAVGFAAGAVVPLREGGRLVACLHAGHAEARPWSDGDRRLTRDAAERTWAATKRARAENAVAEDLAALRRMHALSGKLLEVGELPSVLHAILDAAVAIMRAQKGTAQLLEGDSLRILAHHGHSEPFLQFFAAAENRASVCGEATKRGERVIVPDVEESPLFAGTASLEVLREAGVRAVQSTPMMSRKGVLLGILTTHWGNPYEPDEHDLWRLDLLARQAADIIDHKRAEDALREADRRKTEFLAILSHELRNPLAPITNSLYVLERAAPGGEQARRAQEVIGRQVGQLVRMVDDLLEVTRITRGTIQLQPERLELNDLVRRTIEDHRSLFQPSGVHLAFEPAARPVFVDADKNRIAQVVANLLTNAAKFTPRGGRVDVTVDSDSASRHAILWVADTGTGISPEILPRLFEPFTQADRSLDRRRGGLGLGLALVKGLVEQHGGTIVARSAGLGSGAEFTIRLPLAPTDSARRRREPAPRSVARRRVLVIEDNVDAADSLQDLLEMEGHCVAVAYDGPDGIAKARGFRPELVLCDIGLPDMDGFEVARAFREDEVLKCACLVALSGYALPEDLERAAEAGFARHIAKPPTVEKLREVLESISPPGEAPGP